METKFKDIQTNSATFKIIQSNSTELENKWKIQQNPAEFNGIQN